jgi:hypothetical protein
VNAEVTREIEWLAKSFDTLDTKAMGFMGFLAIAVPFVVLQRREGWYWLAPITVYAVCALAGFFALWPRKLRSAPAPDAVIAAHHRAVASGTPNVKETLLAAVVGTKAAAYDRSFATSRKKLRWFRRCQWLLIFAFLLSIFAVTGGDKDVGRKPAQSRSTTTSAPNSGGPSSTTSRPGTEQPARSSTRPGGG